MIKKNQLSVINTAKFSNESAVLFLEKYKKLSRFKERKKVILDLVYKYTDKKRRILDLGCGPGEFSFTLAEKEYTVIGVDASKVMLDFCLKELNKKSISNVSFKQFKIPDDFEKYSLPEQDLVLASSVLEYVPELNLTIQKVRNVLKEDGIFIISMPNGEGCYRKLSALFFKLSRRPRYYRYVHHVMSLTNFNRLMDTLGFKLLEARYFSKKLIPIKIISKFLPEYLINDFFVGAYKKMTPST